MKLSQIICGDALIELKKLPNDYVDTIITSPPYWGLRDYGIKGQIGLEKTLEEYIEKLLLITKELKRVLKPTGVMFWNHGDCYGGTGTGQKPDHRGKFTPGQFASMTTDAITEMKNASTTPAKCLAFQNYRLILKMIDQQGWILRNTIIWNKPNHMPSSVKDRFTNAYEPVFFLTKSRRYFFDLDVVRVKHTTFEDRPPGVVRKRIFNYRGRDAEKKAKMCPQFKASKAEIEKYKKETGKIKGGGANLNLPRENPKGKNPGDVWTIPTQPFPEAHFATFPEKLIEPMILAGCPKEICKKCGKARVRISKTDYQEAGKGNRNLKRKGGIDPTGSARPYETRKLRRSETIGWTDCNCNAGWEAGIVLDPFMGSGTVAVVAKRLGRQWLGIELSEDYIKIAEARIRAQPEPLF